MSLKPTFLDVDGAHLGTLEDLAIGAKGHDDRLLEISLEGLNLLLSGFVI